ncbi:MAG: carboxylating nicotinate-nucleotide diphosphorylase [Actinobacteria bacterium]|nr:carboxylating nicotinate-nucleotide diphosphorylase [Actinomycetota bacterium]
MELNPPALETYIDLLKRALAEDIGAGDVTSSALIDKDCSSVGVILAKQEGVAAGLVVLEPLCGLACESLKVQLKASDGDSLEAGEEVARISGARREILAVERVALNFLGHLSGIATLTNRFVKAVKDSSALICDTRKTIPGLRVLEKYAVRAGGGTNHRMGLYDSALIKDNHLFCLSQSRQGQSTFEVLALRLKKLRRQLPAGGFIQLEVDDLGQFQQVLNMRLAVDMVLLDNFSNQELAKAVKMRNQAGLAGRLLLEASGNIRLENVAGVASSGVDRISVGALTHSAAGFDFSMEFRQR